MTTAQARDKSKTVTRRQGWKNLKAGELIQQVVKGMGLKKGDKIEKIHVIKIVSVRREPVEQITYDDVNREGFAGWERERFIRFYCEANRCLRSDLCTRIEFEYV